MTRGRWRVRSRMVVSPRCAGGIPSNVVITPPSPNHRWLISSYCVGSNWGLTSKFQVLFRATMVVHVQG